MNIVQFIRWVFGWRARVRQRRLEGRRAYEILIAMNRGLAGVQRRVGATPTMHRCRTKQAHKMLLRKVEEGLK